MASVWELTDLTGDEILRQNDSVQKEADKPESRQQVASLMITLENKKLKTED